MGQILKKFKHREEMCCMAVKEDTNEVIVGTKQNSILLFTLPEEAHRSTSRLDSNDLATNYRSLNVGLTQEKEEAGASVVDIPAA